MRKSLVQFQSPAPTFQQQYIMGIMKELIKDKEEEIDFVELSFELEEWIVSEVNSNL